MNWDILSLGIFYLFLLAVYFIFKNKFEVQGKVFIMYKSKIGLNLMDKISRKFPRLLHWISYVSVASGFLGMIFIFYFLIRETFKYVSVPGTAPPLSPVLPGIAIPGAPTLSFWHWLIALFVVATVHEFSHGIYARLYAIKVKSSGFAFLGPILAAFVEPDERQMATKSKFSQLAVLSAGPFSNLVLGGIFLLLLIFVISPVISYTFQPDGVIVSAFVNDYPMSKTGIALPFVIESINGVPVATVDDFAKATESLKPDDTVKLGTDKGEYSVVLADNPDKPGKGFMGVTGFSQKQYIRDSLEFLGRVPMALLWINLLFVWLFLISLGVGLFNLLPLGPVDGGKMFYLGAWAVFKDEKKAKRIYLAVTWFILLLIFINLAPWLIKLFSFIVKSFMFLVSLA